MTSNTKLTPEQKNLRKLLVDCLPTVTLENNGQTTVAYRDNEQSTVEFSLAVASLLEKKFRRKVGEYLALDRFDNGQTVKMGRNDFYNMLENMGFVNPKLDNFD